MTLKIRNLEIYVSFTFIALISLIVISGFATNYLLCFIAVIIHELGHILPMRLLCDLPSAIKIYPFNIEIINRNKYTNSFIKEFIITLCGPLINLIMFCIFYFVDKSFAYVNLALGLFNLLPCDTLDGGQLLYLILCKFLSNRFAVIIINIITILFFIPVFIMGVLVLFKSKYNFSLLFLSLYLILSLFVKNSKFL